MITTPQSEHSWLEQIIGEWSFEHDCTMPDGSASKAAGTMNCRSLGGMWLIAESAGRSPDAGSWSSIMTVGFDPQIGRYVGTFVGSMMANIWHYQGDLDKTGKRLPLECQGPNITGDGICNYRDTIEIVDKDHWLFTSEMQIDHQQWIRFLNGTHRRAA